MRTCEPTHADARLRPNTSDDPTIWEVDDALWARRAPVLVNDKARKKPGRPRRDDRLRETERYCQLDRFAAPISCRSPRPGLQHKLRACPYTQRDVVLLKAFMDLREYHCDSP